MKEAALLGVLAKEGTSLIEKVGRYYLHDRSFERPYPAVEFLEHASRKFSMLASDQPMEPISAPVRFAFASPVPSRPVLGDLHGNVFPIVSSKIKDAIATLVSECAEFIPAEIIASGQAHAYWILHHLRQFDVLDKENFDFELFDSGNYWYIDELYLDYAKLAKIPLEERMIFKLAGSADKYFWHESVKQAVEATEATGISFTFSQGYVKDEMYLPQPK